MRCVHAIIASLTLVALSPCAPGDLVGIEVRTDSAWNEHATAAIGHPAQVYRFFATFDGATEVDNVVSVDTNYPFTSVRFGYQGDEPNASIYRHPMGGHLPPLEDLIAQDPALAWHSFVTIGATSIDSEEGSPLDAFGLAWEDGEGDGRLDELAGIWFVADPASDLGGAVESGDGLARVLIAQITIVHDCALAGSSPMGGATPGSVDDLGDTVIKGFDDNTQRLFDGSFVVTTPLGDGEPGYAAHLLSLRLLYPAPPIKADVNRDYVVDAADLAYLLSHWGDADPDADVAPDCNVDARDLAEMLGNWGAYAQ